MNAKPIFTIGLPSRTPHNEVLEIVEKTTNNFNNEYHILAYISSSDVIEFQCFYEKDFNEVKYDELKKIVMDKIKKTLC